MIWIKVLLMAIAVTALFATAMGLKLLFDKNDSSGNVSCGADSGTSQDTFACSHCAIKEIANCDKKPAFD
jgi:hypothetical protein